MGDHCGSSDHLHKKVLWILLLINGGMFVVEFVFGILARSTSLLADSADMFSDAIIYGGSFLVVGKSTLAKAKVSFAKGLIMLLVGMGALYEAISKWITHSQPDPETMGIVGSLALVANLTVRWA